MSGRLVKLVGMDQDRLCQPEGFRVDYPGPFSQHDVVVNGWTVPLVQAQTYDGDQITLVLDNRFGLDLSLSEAERVVPFLADAIAIALGYSAHPSVDDDAPRDLPHLRPRRVHTIAGVED